ncbi:hypothetical protein [Acerihabitans arboris]|uniref:Uncharacterized protein n=1 Tax=Acerihabitans arboris TaxID=2691583 RepID=A0A845SIB8_9GAMM|nr:hypothetical protein [Acerihabitans arboris]NDL62361.1 hypothetical protein [Acerihabitans arboris]
MNTFFASAVFNAVALSRAATQYPPCPEGRVLPFPVVAIQNYAGDGGQPAFKRDAAVAGLDDTYPAQAKTRRAGELLPPARPVHNTPPPGVGATGGGSMVSSLDWFCLTARELCLGIEVLQHEMDTSKIESGFDQPEKFLGHFNRLMDMVSRYIDWMRCFNQWNEDDRVRIELHKNISLLGPIIEEMIKKINVIESIFLERNSQ